MDAEHPLVVSDKPKGKRTGLTCNAHTRDGSICNGLAVRGRTKCRMHGGRSLSGTAVSTYKHGRYAKSLPTQIAQRAEAARTNPRLLSLSDDIAVAEALLAEKFGALATGESAACWQTLRTTLGAFEAALARGDFDGMQGQFEAMRALVQRGAAGAGVVDEIHKLWDTRAKLIATEVKTLQTMSQMVTTQQMMVWLGTIIHEVTQAVEAEADLATSRKILSRIHAALAHLATLEESRRGQ